MNPGTPFSLLLIASGAVLAWGVDDRVDAVNLAAIGAILIVVGIIGLMFSLAFWTSVFGGHSHGNEVVYRDSAPVVYREEPPVIVDRGPREVVHERRERVVRRDEYDPRV